MYIAWLIAWLAACIHPMVSSFTFKWRQVRIQHQYWICSFLSDFSMSHESHLLQNIGDCLTSQTCCLSQMGDQWWIWAAAKRLCEKSLATNSYCTSVLCRDPAGVFTTRWIGHCALNSCAKICTLAIFTKEAGSKCPLSIACYELDGFEHCQSW
jgi:hypothetical protein